MKKQLLILLLMMQSISSELMLEITKGSDDPYSVAILNFSGSEDVSRTIQGVIINDLKRTGEFRVLEENQLLSSPSAEDEINYDDFKLLNIDYIVMASIIEEDANNLFASYKIFSVKKNHKLEHQKFLEFQIN